MQLEIEKQTDDNRTLWGANRFYDLNAQEIGGKWRVMCFQTFCRLWLQVSTVVFILLICKMF